MSGVGDVPSRSPGRLLQGRNHDGVWFEFHYDAVAIDRADAARGDQKMTNPVWRSVDRQQQARSGAAYRVAVAPDFSETPGKILLYRDETHNQLWWDIRETVRHNIYQELSA